ncbi:MAG TPA: hypothetical protein VF169_11250 [Albitalea sp.]|uniref:hypothetical protein n=1 Tax=Piscinibacter sp. TaxID=1903157 RepID=UPI002ED40FC8
MKSIVVSPFRTADTDRVTAAPWMTIADGSLIPLPQVVDGMDYTTTLELRREVRVDVDGIRADCGLPPGAELILSVSWHSAGTALRRPLFNSQLPVDSGSVGVSVAGQVAADAIAGHLTLRTRILLARALCHEEAMVARHAGSELWAENHRVALDSVTSLFPVELVDLSGAIWAQPDAGWILSWNTYELDKPFLGSVRLYVNSNHAPVARAVVGPALTRDAAVLRQAIYFDVARSLILGALNDSEFIQRAEDYPPDSTGRVVRDMIQRLWRGETLAGLKNTAETSPDHFNAELQARLEIFKG